VREDRFDENNLTAVMYKCDQDLALLDSDPTICVHPRLSAAKQLVGAM
jgi:hypothetical protein